MQFEAYLAERCTWLPAFARVLTGRPDSAEDLVQDVLIRAQRHWERITAADDPDAYLRRMVVNEYLRSARRRSREVPVERVDTGDVAPDHAERVVARDQARRLVAQLPPRQRTAVVLRYFSNLSDPEIAAAMGCSAGAVRSYLSRALAAMRIDVAADDRMATRGTL